MERVKRFLYLWRDPATAQGTARWVALGVVAWDLLKNGATWPNIAGLLTLAGLDIAAHWLNNPPPPPAMA